MIVYSGTKETFTNDLLAGRLISSLKQKLQTQLRAPGKREVASWQNSLTFMNYVISDSEIPNDAGIALEYVIPNTANRIDFLITGYNEEDHKNIVIVELKQWSEVYPVKDKVDIVKTPLGGSLSEVPHPSYQAWSYASMIESYNASIEEKDLRLIPCAYLHNYYRPDVESIVDEHYADILSKAPLFDARGILQLREFIKTFVKRGDQQKVIYELDAGKIRPSKSLQDKLTSMLEGNTEFILIDEQKLVYEQAIALAEKAKYRDKKYVLIVEGGPGTGKSVVAINLLTELTRRGMLCHFISKNAAPREVYKQKLKGHLKADAVDNLFQNSGIYYQWVEGNVLDVAIVDEAHRLNEKSGFYSNQGENQIKEIIAASNLSIFFIDEDQQIALADIGQIDTILHFAKKAKADVHQAELVSQFRCNGSDGYIAWLDDVLQLRDTANFFFDFDYDFDVVDDPRELLSWVRLNNVNDKARIVAGYCWKWPVKERQNPDHFDIVLDEYDFAMSWNLKTGTWAIDPGSLDQAGCIHTSQGLEFEYVGVIIGPDMRFENGQIVTDFDERASTDQSLKGIKKLAKNNPDEAKRIADRLIKNTYRTLMTRGMKGCRVFCTDKNLAAYLKARKTRSYDMSGFEEEGYGISMVAEQVTDYGD